MQLNMYNAIFIFAKDLLQGIIVTKILFRLFLFIRLLYYQCSERQGKKDPKMRTMQNVSKGQNNRRKEG